MEPELSMKDCFPMVYVSTLGILTLWRSG